MSHMTHHNMELSPKKYGIQGLITLEISSIVQYSYF